MPSGRLAAVSALILALGCAACDSSGGAADGGWTPLEAPTGLQPGASIAADAPDRVEKSLLTTLPGLDRVAIDPEYADDVASPVCGNKQGPQAYSSESGMRREWRGPQVKVHQFAGAFGAVTAEQAIDQVAGKLACGSYPAQDRDGGEYTGVHKVTVPSTRLAFCETSPGKNAFCTGLLARDDILVRIQVAAVDEAAATKLLGDVTGQSSEVLRKAW
ncbi:hypothetical protein GCM10010172_58130 [Paractinoplanes ferrugineus]|uniref:PknH-like extracellular domain-containing protein n=1 Tax=Paractinoplanes ferrugineus TaxID=113564 RepID=A0A919JA62_9ACTN|nr:hypothetical protein [Actinoplanes ferrugineus]GIE15883.1 hypothetical protein Afe05nite_77230 [Actinoplanes ferrugineus]